MHSKRFRSLRSAFALSTLAAAVIFLRSVTVDAVEVGETPPAFVVKMLNDQPFDLSAERGKVVLVNFWATWCPPCREELPVLDSFYRKYHEQGVEMLGLSTDRAHDRSDVLEAAKSFSYPAAMLIDASAKGLGNPNGLPSTVVIDRNGVVRTMFSGPVTKEDLDKAVLPLLSQGDAP